MTEMTERQQRFEHGKAVLDAIDGPAGANVIDALGDISPELGHQVFAWGFGEIYSRPGLEPRDRQLVTLGMLTALGGCEPQLDVHINALPPRARRATAAGLDARRHGCDGSGRRDSQIRTFAAVTSVW
jgi:Carboxymuconolactone decarboxylase family